MSAAKKPVVVAHNLRGAHPKVLELLEAAEGIRLVEVADAPNAIPADAEVLFTRSTPHVKALKGTPKPADWPPPGLRWTQVLSAGVDSYPDWMLDAPPLRNAKGSTAPAIAEYVITAMLAVCKNWNNIAATSPSNWKFRTLTNLADATVGVAGMGPIGEYTARLVAALGARVLGWRRTPTPMEGIELVGSFEELIGQSDHLVLALPATAATRSLIDARTLALAKPGLHLINVARGALVDEQALLAALDAGQIGFATLDVAREEPPAEGHPFYSHPRVKLTPHSSWVGGDAERRVVARFLDNLRREAVGEPMDEPVDRIRGY